MVFHQKICWYPATFFIIQHLNAMEYPMRKLIQFHWSILKIVIERMRLLLYLPGKILHSLILFQPAELAMPVYPTVVSEAIMTLIQPTYWKSLFWLGLPSRPIETREYDFVSETRFWFVPLLHYCEFPCSLIMYPRQLDNFRFGWGTRTTLHIDASLILKIMQNKTSGWFMNHFFPF